MALMYFLSVTFLTERHYNYQYNTCGIENDHVLFALKVVTVTLQMHSVLGLPMYMVLVLGIVIIFLV